MGREWMVGRAVAGLAALVAAYVGSVGVEWLLRWVFLRDGGWDGLVGQWVLSGFAHFVMALMAAFGLPLLLLGTARVMGSSARVAMVGGAAVGMCMAGGVAFLFGMLLRGKGLGFFVGALVVFGGVAGVLAVVVFRGLARGVRIRVTDAASEATLVKRVGLSAGAVVAGGSLVCALLFIVTAIIDRQHGAAWWIPVYRFSAVFLVSGWLVFGLPLLVAGPARERFGRPTAAAVAGGVAGVVFVECYFQTMFVGSFSWAAVVFHTCFGVLAFLLGALTSYLYAAWSAREATRD